MGEIMKSFRDRLIIEEGLIGRAALPELVVEPGAGDVTPKAIPKSKDKGKAAAVQPSIRQVTIDGAVISDAEFTSLGFKVGARMKRVVRDSSDVTQFETVWSEIKEINAQTVTIVSYLPDGEEQVSLKRCQIVDSFTVEKEDEIKAALFNRILDGVRVRASLARVRGDRSGEYMGETRDMPPSDLRLHRGCPQQAHHDQRAHGGHEEVGGAPRARRLQI